MKKITNNFKTHAAEQFRESFSEPANTIYYMGAHRSLPFADDGTPPAPVDSIDEIHYSMFDELLFGKHITSNDVSLMVKNNTWTSNTVYSMYDDQTEDLDDETFYVVSPEGSDYHIFKCLNNNGGAASTDQPLFSETDPEDELYITTDGYQWKYMYTVSNADYSKFATAEYIPVTPNANVVSNAANGAIDTVLVSTVGSSYNSYAECTVKEAAVAGNTLLYSLSGERFTDYLITVDDVTGFVKEEVSSLNNAGKTATGIIVAIFPANNTIQVTNSVNDFDASTTLTGSQSSETASITGTSRLTTSLSANTDFYKNNSMYIRHGTGAGQLRTITEYIVTGDEKRVLVNSPFNPMPDTSSIVEIGPRVIISGDGNGANAVATVDPSTNSIAEVEIINRGTNYSYADITITANTGQIDSNSNTVLSTSANARAIISPIGGHGSDAAKELFANKVGISVSFANNESSTIPDVNDYRKFSIIKEPRFANVELTLESSFSATSFQAGETVTQANTGATGLISNRSGQTLRLTDVRGFFESGNSTVNIVTGDESAYAAQVDTIDKSVTTFDQRETYQVEMLSNGPSGNGFATDELVIQPGLDAISSDLVKLVLEQSAYVYNDGEIINQASSGASGTVSDRYDNTVTLTNITGTFVSGNVIGDSANTETTVINIDNTIAANAFGHIHEINANSSVISLASVRGVFNISDDVAGTVNVFNGNDTEAVAKITGRDYTRNYLMDNKGDILYVETMLPIERNSSQTETVKVIIEF